MTNPFKFKQFTINQLYAPMKVGTDGVLLGAWCSCTTAQTALDIGTGTGLIALMLAQRNSSLRITAIEPNPLALQDAAPNIETSDWKERIVLHKADLASIQFSEKFDLIIANPPFFSNSLKAPDADRTMARHIADFSPRAFAEAAVQCMHPDGILSGIYPIDSFEEFDKTAAGFGLAPSRLCAVRPTPEKPAHRMLFEYTFAERHTTTFITELIIEDKGRHNYSDAYRKLTADFYLSF